MRVLGGFWVIMVFPLFELYAFDIISFQDIHVPFYFSYLHIRWGLSRASMRYKPDGVLGCALNREKKKKKKKNHGL